MREFKGKAAFITGGGSGVGFGQAKVFAREGMKVAIADIRQDHLDEAMAYFKAHGGEVHPILLDITDRAAYARAADEVERVFGRPVQLLCNTAGVSIFGLLQDATYDDWDWVMGVNVGGVINGVQTFVPRMVAYGQGGHIVNTASMAAFMIGKSRGGIYGASKFAVHGISEGLRNDLEDVGIGVSVLCPGAVNSNIHESVLSRPEKWSNTGYYGADPAIFKQLKAVIEPGFEPEALAEKVLEAIKRNDFYIIPYAEFREPIRQIYQRVIDAMPLPEDDPDMERRNAALRARMQERGQEK